MIPNGKFLYYRSQTNSIFCFSSVDKKDCTHTHKKMWNSLWYSTTESKDAITGISSSDVGIVSGKAKVVMVGDSCVGKSALLTRLKKGGYQDNFITTVSEDFHTQLFDIKGNHFHNNSDGSRGNCTSSSCASVIRSREKMQLNIHDTGGQDRALDLIPIFYRGANAFIIVYDVTSTESFAAVKTWADRILKHAGTTNATGSGNLIKLLVGNKCDSLERIVSEEEGRKMADSIDAGFIETSAKRNINVQDIFTSVSGMLVEQIIADISANSKSGSDTTTSRITLQLPSSSTSDNFPIFATHYAQCQSLPATVSGWCW